LAATSCCVPPPCRVINAVRTTPLPPRPIIAPSVMVEPSESTMPTGEPTSAASAGGEDADATGCCVFFFAWYFSTALTWPRLKPKSVASSSEVSSSKVSTSSKPCASSPFAYSSATLRSFNPTAPSRWARMGLSSAMCAVQRQSLFGSASGVRARWG
jgi:hypothetical protein